MISSIDLAWAAGFIEGEGSFSTDSKQNSISVQVSQVQWWPLEKLQQLFGGTVYPVHRCLRPGQSPYSRWRVSGPRAAGVAMTLWTFLSPKRRSQAVKALGNWKKAAVSNAMKTHCAHGHEYTEENTYRWGKRNHRYCKTCQGWKPINRPTKGQG